VLVWIIDDEWSGYAIEEALLKKELPGVEIVYTRGSDAAAGLAAFGPKADAVVCQVSVAMNAGVIDKLERCKVISVYGAGYNNVDVAAARRRGIAVCNVPGYCADDVSDYVIAALYYWNKRIAAYAEELKNGGGWGAQAAPEIGRRLHGQTLFVAGYGRIGRAVAKKAGALGLKTLAWSPRHAPGPEVEAVSLDEGLSRADFVTVHVALRAETEGMANAAFFARMKRGAYFINTSRGKVVDEAALIAALKSGHLRGAMLDVLAAEPPPDGAEILRVPGLVVTPHISYLSRDALDELQKTAAQNAADILNGRPSNNVVPGGVET